LRKEWFKEYTGKLQSCNIMKGKVAGMHDKNKKAAERIVLQPGVIVRFYMLC